jgi:hypothetical protein
VKSKAFEDWFYDVRSALRPMSISYDDLVRLMRDNRGALVGFYRDGLTAQQAAKRIGLPLGSGHEIK